MATLTQLGYRPNDPSVIVTRTVPGTSVHLPLVEGPAGDLLVEVAKFFHEHIEPIEGGGRGFHIRDDWGFAKRLIRGSLTKLSRHAYGCAEDLNATRHPLGVRGTFTATQKRKMNAFLATLDGCVRWGENYLVRVDGMHFEIMKSQADCARALAKVRAAVDHKPGSRDLRRGMIGDDVARVQQIIKAPVDGVYGKVTAQRVKEWERAYNRRTRLAGAKPLLVDGVVGLGTWRAMGVQASYKVPVAR